MSFFYREPGYLNSTHEETSDEEASYHGPPIAMPVDEPKIRPSRREVSVGRPLVSNANSGQPIYRYTGAIVPPLARPIGNRNYGAKLKKHINTWPWVRQQRAEENAEIARSRRNRATYNAKMRNVQNAMRQQVVQLEKEKKEALSELRRSRRAMRKKWMNIAEREAAWKRSTMRR